MDSPTDTTERVRAAGTATAEPTTETPDVPLVTAVITTYNRPSYLREAVLSVREQTYDAIELVVVDDHSRDPAEATVDELDLTGLSSVQCVRHDQNRGANAARNTGLDHASGDYVAFLDDDDRWVPEKVERQVEAFRTADEDVGVVYTGRETVGRDGREVIVPSAVEGEMTKALLCRNVVGTLSVIMVRTDVATAVRFDEAFPAWADLEWYIRLSRRTSFRRLPEALTVYEFTSHGRLSEDVDKKIESYELFLERFDHVARAFGWCFTRKMHAWAAFRVGKSALATRNYDTARTFFAAAIARYPLEPQFFRYFLGTVGGRATHRLARGLKELTT